MNLFNDGELIIAKATVEDATDIVNFLNKVGGETDFLTFGFNEFPISIQEEKNIINECNDQECNLMLVGKINGEVISQLFLERSSLPRVSHIGTFGVTVSKNHWRKSIGKKMILIALDWAKLKNLMKLQLSVRSDHVAAIELYKKLGFQIEGITSKAVLINGIYFDNYLMGLEL